MTYTFLFFNLGGGEILIILFIVLLLFGSKKIPELAKGLGKGLNEFKKATTDIQKEIISSAPDNPVNEVKKEVESIKKEVEKGLLP